MKYGIMYKPEVHRVVAGRLDEASENFVDLGELEDATSLAVGSAAEFVLHECGGTVSIEDYEGNCFLIAVTRVPTSMEV